MQDSGTYELTMILGAATLLRRNLLVYGLGGVIVPFVGIKLIDVLIAFAGWA